MQNTLIPYSPTEKKDSSIIVLYGTPDSGKSTLALTATTGYRTAYFDIERMALDRLVDMPAKNVDAGKLFDMGIVDSLEQVLAFLNSPTAQQVDIVVIDSMTHLLNKMTAHTNPSSLKGNAVFGYYRDLGRLAVFICEKAREKKVNIIMTAQATKDKKGYEGVFVPDITGKETIDTLRDLSDMVLVEKTGYGKRNVWMDTNDSYCLTKSKGLPIGHEEKIPFEGLENFSLNTILGERKLYIKPAPKKITKAQVTALKKSIKESDKIRPLEIANLFNAAKLDEKPLADLFTEEYEHITLILDARTESAKSRAKIAKQAA